MNKFNGTIPSKLLRLKEIYLSKWLGFANKGQLDQAMSLAELLYPVRYLLGFNRV